MPVWLTQLVALSALVGVIGFCFWMARGVKPHKGNTDDFQALGLPENQAVGHPDNSGSGHG